MNFKMYQRQLNLNLVLQTYSILLERFMETLIYRISSKNDVYGNFQHKNRTTLICYHFLEIAQAYIQCLWLEQRYLNSISTVISFLTLYGYGRTLTAIYMEISFKQQQLQNFVNSKRKSHFAQSHNLCLSQLKHRSYHYYGYLHTNLILTGTSSSLKLIFVFIEIFKDQTTRLHMQQHSLLTHSMP